MVEDCRTGGIGRDVKIRTENGGCLLDGTITIALFIKYLLGFIMRERRMTVSYLFFLHCIVHFLCIGVSTIGAICT